MLPSSFMDFLRNKYGDGLSDYQIPPPVFSMMEGELVSFDMDNQTILAHFPVRERYLNPYRVMQGGIIAAAVDNTVGPLSMLVAPPNVTRRLDMKYSHSVTPEIGYISVMAKLVNRKGRNLTFNAEVRDPEGKLLARARSTHWILDE